MIGAAKNRGFEKLFEQYNERWLIRRHFHRVSVLGSPDAAPPDAPVLYAANHVSWWDGLLVFAAIRRLSVRAHFAMMDEEQLARFRFFRKLGAFSVDKRSARSAASSLAYAETLLRPGQGVWLFPQGELRHQEERPIRLSGGAGWLLERCPEAYVQPVTLYYSFGSNQRPDVSVAFWPALRLGWADMGRREATRLLGDTLERRLDEHRQRTIAAAGGIPGSVPDGIPAGFAPLISGVGSTSEAFESITGRLGRWKAFFGS